MPFMFCFAVLTLFHPHIYQRVPSFDLLEHLANLRAANPCMTNLTAPGNGTVSSRTGVTAQVTQGINYDTPCY